MKNSIIKSADFEAKCGEFVLGESHAFTLVPFSSVSRSTNQIHELEKRVVSYDFVRYSNNANLCYVLGEARRILDGPVYIVFMDSKDYGVVKLPSIKLFNCQFDLTVDPLGIVSILSIDLKNRIIVDYEEHDSKFSIEVDLQGPAYSLVDL